MSLPWIVALTLLIQLILGWAPVADRPTWALENCPVWIGLILLAFTWRRFPLSRLTLNLLFIHGIILAVGGHWTYAKVPIGDWLKDALDLERNHYDRLGHLTQGFVPAIFVRELLLRTSPLRGSRWLPVLTFCVCLAFSACYEFIEWAVALVAGSGATDFLGTQGDPWDTQWDMFLASIGAIAALACLSRWHDRSIGRLGLSGT
jgi:putative membrane protein